MLGRHAIAQLVEHRVEAIVRVLGRLAIAQLVEHRVEAIVRVTHDEVMRSSILGQWVGIVFKNSDIFNSLNLVYDRTLTVQPTCTV